MSWATSFLTGDVRKIGPPLAVIEVSSVAVPDGAGSASPHRFSPLERGRRTAGVRTFGTHILMVAAT